MKARILIPTFPLHAIWAVLCAEEGSCSKWDFDVSAGNAGFRIIGLMASFTLGIALHLARSIFIHDKTSFTGNLWLSLNHAQITNTDLLLARAKGVKECVELRHRVKCVRRKYNTYL